MIRVLHIFNIMNCGGAETLIMNIYRNIDREKIQFDFLCMSDEKGDYDEEIKRLGGNIYRISSPSKKGYIKHINSIIKICKEKGPYKAIHIPTQFHSGIVCLAAWIAKVQIRIVHSHSAGEDDKSIIRNIYQFICRILINIFSTDKIACGEKARDFLFGKTDKNKKNVLILKNGIDIEKFQNINISQVEEFKRKLEINPEEIIIGHVGRFVHVKNHKFFIKLAKEYKKISNRFKILLVGEGPMKNDLEKEIKNNNLSEHFIFLGKQNNIPLIMNSIDVFVMPSLYEGFPMVIVEALAAGKTCILSDSISKEVDIFKNSVKFLNLNDDIELWCKSIHQCSNINVDRYKIDKILIEKGFDIKNTVNILEKIYLR